jgi:hypothetical protein
MHHYRIDSAARKQARNVIAGKSGIGGTRGKRLVTPSVEWNMNKGGRDNRGGVRICRMVIRTTKVICFGHGCSPEHGPERQFSASSDKSICDLAEFAINKLP